MARGTPAFWRWAAVWRRHAMPEALWARAGRRGGRTAHQAHAQAQGHGSLARFLPVGRSRNSSTRPFQAPPQTSELCGDEGRAEETATVQTSFILYSSTASESILITGKLVKATQSQLLRWHERPPGLSPAREPPRRRHSEVTAFLFNRSMAPPRREASSTTGRRMGQVTLREQG